MKKIAFLVTILILGFLYASIDRPALLQHLRNMHLGIFFLALGFFIPQVLVTVVRWRWMIWDIYPMSIPAAAQLILAGKALNALLPSKLGETSKAYFLKTHADVPLPHGVALVLLEKVLDVAGLCTMLLLGLLAAPQVGLIEVSATSIAVLVLLIVAGICTANMAGVWRRVQRYGREPAAGDGSTWKHRARRVWQQITQRLVTLFESWDMILATWRQHRVRLVGILLLSCLLWSLHLAQIFLFFVALHSSVGMNLVFAYVPIGIFIGLLPLTIGGMGTRDSALIVLFAPYESAAVMAGIGLLCSLRYWLDSLLGLPFFYTYSFGKD